MLNTIAACQSRSLNTSDSPETRARSEQSQRKKGGSSMFGKWTTRKGLNLILAVLLSAL